MPGTVASLEAALAQACQHPPNRRVLVAHIDGADTQWWGGSIDDWQPDETRLTSRAAFERYMGLVRDFRNARLPTAHAMMAYRDGRFASVMLGVSAREAAAGYLAEAMNVVRARSTYSWLKV
jgi:hypothetical protein